MALNSKSVETAWYILHEINPNAKNSFIQLFDKEDKYQEDTILGSDPKADGGWEEVFMNVKDITPEQIEIFNRRKTEIPNSSFMEIRGNRITVIGWF